MHIVVTGATGRIGSVLMETLPRDPRVRSVTGIARRVENRSAPKTYYVSADVAVEPLAPLFEGADAVVHLAWQFQPERRPDELWSTNVLGSRRVFDAIRQAGVPRLVYASSFGVYAPREGVTPVDESFATTGYSTSLYSRHKAEVERRLDEFEGRYEGFGIARLRPVATLAPSAASQLVERIAGAMPGSAIDEAVLRVARQIARAPLQVAHAFDVAAAFHLAAIHDVRGAFNIAPRAPRVHESNATLAPSGIMTKAASLALRLRLSRHDQNLVDLAANAPLLDDGRAQRVLGYCAEYSTERVLAGALCSLRAGDRSPRDLWAWPPTAQLSNSAHVSVHYPTS